MLFSGPFLTEKNRLQKCQRGRYDLREENGLEILTHVSLVHPRAIVIADDQVLFSVQAAEYRFRIFATEKKIADDVNGIAPGNAAVPISDKGYNH